MIKKIGVLLLGLCLCNLPVMGQSVQTIGTLSAKIANNAVNGYEKTGILQDAKDPVTSAGDWGYNSWRITRVGGSIKFFVPADKLQKDKDVFLRLTYAGWGDATKINLTMNGETVITARPVAGHAWGNPDVGVFDISRLAKSANGVSVIELTLTDDSPMVLFFQSMAIEVL
ncbi:MAG: hypothetical protein JNM27_19105 [Leptospirales bacterium]|nr:hypothetical protein [Leptospirales bacterium]